jgi:hypothetical protein
MLPSTLRPAAIMIVLCLVAFLLPCASGQARLRAGERVVTQGKLDPVCVSREQAKNYTNASFECERGSDADCAAAKKLRAQKVCGFHYSNYTVIAVESQTSLIKLSPTGHESEFYWGDEESFHPVFKPGDKVSPEGDLDPVCVKKTDIKTYVAARRKCESWLDKAQCAVAKKLEGAKACGFHYKTYTVVSVDDPNGLIELSPAGHNSELYWAETDDFAPTP